MFFNQPDEERAEQRRVHGGCTMYYDVPMDTNDAEMKVIENYFSEFPYKVIVERSETGTPVNFLSPCPFFLAPLAVRRELLKQSEAVQQ